MNDNSSRQIWDQDEAIHAWWVWPGHFLAGEYPGDLSRANARKKIAILLDAGIDSFVDLTESGELDPYAPRLLAYVAKTAGVPVPTYRRFAIRDVDVLPNDSDYDDIVEYIQSELEAGRRVYVHCWGGKGRTGTVVGCWLIDKYGLDYDTTIGRMHEFRIGTRKFHSKVRIPETAEQHGVIRRRAARRML